MSEESSEVSTKQQPKSVKKVASRCKQVAPTLPALSARRNIFCDTKMFGKTSHPDTETDFSQFNVTPLNSKNADVKNFAKAGKTTSTPAFDNLSALVPECDASAIVNQSCIIPQLKENFASVEKKELGKFKPISSRRKIQAQPKDIPVVILPGQQKNKDIKVESGEIFSEADVDLLYSQYIAAIFIESRTKKSLEFRCRDTLDRLYKLWKVNQILMEQDKSLYKELDTISYMQQLLDHLKFEKEVYQPVLDVLPKIMAQYSEITEAIDTIRHKLHMPGVLFSSKYNFEEELTDLLKTCQMLLGTFYQDFSPEIFQLSTVGDLLIKMQSLLDETLKEISSCLCLLSKVDKLTLQESVLKISEFQI